MFGLATTLRAVSLAAALAVALGSCAHHNTRTCCGSNTAASKSPSLSSWAETDARASIVKFVNRVTDKGSPDYVPPAERIAVFDNDGTLWAEQPMYFQLAFALDRVKALAPQHPEWQTTEPFASILKGDLKSALAGGNKAIAQIVGASHSGMTTDEFNQVVKEWIKTARHPTLNRPYTDLVYQPMLELLAYLRANGFKTFIVSGGGVEFMRAFAEEVYGIPPEQVIGSRGKTTFALTDNDPARPILNKLPDIDFIDDGPGKPVAINAIIGRRPILAAGNSDGDQQMLQWIAAGSGARLCILVHHTDAQREWAYDRDSHIGKLDKALDEAAARGWTVVSMKTDWKEVFSAESSAADITAIDILLEPDAEMLKRCEANNARLLNAFPKGFSLDATHTPHITMLQCFVRTADLNKVYAAAEKVLIGANVNSFKLDAFKYYYAPAGATGVAGICAKPTPEILTLQADIIAAVKPFMLGTGPIGAFTASHEDPAIDAAIIQYVSTFVPNMSGANFNPHVSTGVAPTAYLDQMLTEPFEPFTFSPAGAAVYQLGPFGTAAKELKAWDLGP